MRLAFWSSYGRGACAALAAAGLAVGLSACSSGVSRFDFPAFNLTDSGSSGNADPNTTASLPVPSESVYSTDRYHYYGDAQASGGQITRSSLPPPKATQASYTPMQKPQARGYAPPGPKPAVAASGPRIKVQSGDTLSSLSRRYGVSIDKIQSANNLPDARLRVGQELIMPGASAAIAEAAPAATPTPTPTPAVASTALAAGETAYIVAEGDTPNSIAEKLGADEQAIIARNGVRPDSLQIGQKLIIPAASAAPSLAAAETTPSGVRKVKTTTIPAPGSAPAPDAMPGIAASPEVIGGNAQKLASVEQLPSPDPMSGASFRWPVKGRIISGFGTKPDGGHNDGINISVPQGTPVKAAENGVVAYAGSELKGYGNLVLVRHANNWVSAYANNEAILVKRGDKVTRGQVIAKAGASGSVSQPQVHFELRKGSRPVDPTKYMSSMTAEAD
ncbi:MAG: peptidoglycan DD-metalloendopeptidase family protein [Methyloceanibacter sp.]|uniref:peptidoglycan DD-metalloendopeptidase family protein n=1 Tax=Methyloceanibacter sp. TaxID=1965321 RepID=UPI003D6D4022